ncbi:MAG: hypothetical protein FH751_01675 [Firmicutes bacterium]|nr:hypothetical protein [Bacillota bacterium]
MNNYKPLTLPFLPNVLGGEEGFYNSSVGKIYFNVEGKGSPLLLIHGINAGASNFVWRKNFEELTKEFKVYTIELPGFGRSDKDSIIYRPMTFASAIIEFIEVVIKEPVSVIASDLTADYLFFISFTRKEYIKKLILISPSLKVYSDLPCETSFRTFGLFTGDFIGDGLYNTLTSKKSIDYFLKDRVYMDSKNVTPYVVRYNFLASHQGDNAKYAPASFISGFSDINIVNLIPKIRQPTLIIWGRNNKLSNFNNMYIFLNLNMRFKSCLFANSGALPQVEEYKRFNDVCINFLSSLKC